MNTDIKGMFLPIGQLSGEAYLPTDFAAISGVRVFSNGKAVAWSATPSEHGDVRIVDYNGTKGYYYPTGRDVGALPTLLSSSDSSSIKPSEVRLAGKIFDYPQTAASDTVSKELESAYLGDNNDLIATNRTYTYDSEKWDSYNKPCKYERLQEYEYKGKTYVRIKGQPRDKNSVLANGHQIEERKIYWIEVEPVEWVKGCASKVIYRTKFDDRSCYNGDFFETFACKFLNETVIPEMQEVLDNSKYLPRESDTARAAARRNETSLLEKTQT